MLRESQRASGGDDVPPEPWRSFLRELDERLNEAVELHCIGGFVVSMHYGIGRQTADIDFLTVVPWNPGIDLEEIERNAERDREDVLGLAGAGQLDPGTLEDRYLQELRPYLLGDLERHDLTLRLWLAMCWPAPA